MNLTSYRSALKDLHRFHNLALSLKSAEISGKNAETISTSSKLNATIPDVSIPSMDNSVNSTKATFENDIPTNQSEDCEAINDIDNSTDEEGTLDGRVQEMLDKCKGVADMTNYESNQNFQHARSLCLLLLDKETEFRLFPSIGNVVDIPRNISTVSVIKNWSYSALGLLLLKELIKAVSNMGNKMRDDSRVHVIESGNETEEQITRGKFFQTILKELVIENILGLLEHSEPRIRAMCSEILCLIAQNERIDYDTSINRSGFLYPSYLITSDAIGLKDSLLGTSLTSKSAASSVSLQHITSESSQKKSIENESKVKIYFSLYHSIGMSLLKKVQIGLHEDRSTTSRPTNLGDTAFIALDDTTGWCTLESSILAVHGMFRGYGSVFSKVLIESENIKLKTKNIAEEHSVVERSTNDDCDILLNCLISGAAVHVNRHVRESVYSFIRILCDPLLRIPEFVPLRGDKNEIDIRKSSISSNSNDNDNNNDNNNDHDNYVNKNSNDNSNKKDSFYNIESNGKSNNSRGNSSSSSSDVNNQYDRSDDNTSNSNSNSNDYSNSKDDEDDDNNNDDIRIDSNTQKVNKKVKDNNENDDKNNSKLENSNRNEELRILSFYAIEMIKAIKLGMEDKWCQIRRSGLIAAKSFLLSSLSYDLEISNDENNMKCYINVDKFGKNLSLIGDVDDVDNILCNDKNLNRVKYDNNGSNVFEDNNISDSNSIYNENYNDYNKRNNNDNNSNNDIDINFYWIQLLPGLCMNRFYVADGVHTIAKDIWMNIINKSKIGKGKELVEKYIEFVIEYYIKMSKSSNHMISEASLSGINELVLKINKNIVLPYINIIINDIIICLYSDSWPIVDSATISSGSLLKFYEKECEEHLYFFLNKWSESTKSPIWSVRENSSIAFCDALKCTDLIIKKKILKYITDYLDENLSSAKKEIILGEKNIQFIPNHMMEIMLENERKIIRNNNRENKRNFIKTTNNNENNEDNEDNENFKINEINEKENIIKMRQKGSWGCCLDCLEIRKNSPWENSDGCIYLIRELSFSYSEIAFTYLPQVFELLKLEGYKNCHKLHTTILHELPSIFKSGNDSDDERIRTIETADYPQNNKDQLVVDSNEFNISPLSLEGHPTSPISPSTVCLSPQLISPSSLLPSSSSSSLSSSSSSSQPISLTLGAPRVSNKRRGREGGRDSDTDNSRSNIPKNLNRNHLRGSDAAKLFLEEHSILLHRIIHSKEFPSRSLAAADCSVALSKLLGRSIFMHKVHPDVQKRGKPQLLTMQNLQKKTPNELPSRYFLRASDLDEKFYWATPFKVNSPITCSCMVSKVGDNYVAATADALNMSGECRSKEDALLDLKLVIERAIKDRKGASPQLQITLPIRSPQ